MSTDNTSALRGYQLPFQDNTLSYDVFRLIAALNAIDTDVSGLLSSLTTKAPLSHTHAIGEVVGLTAALAAKSDTTHTHALTALTGVSISGAASGQFLRYNGTNWANATLAQSDVTGLPAALSALQSQIDIIDGGTF